MLMDLYENHLGIKLYSWCDENGDIYTTKDGRKPYSKTSLEILQMGQFVKKNADDIKYLIDGTYDEDIIVPKNVTKIIVLGRVILNGYIEMLCDSLTIERGDLNIRNYRKHHPLIGRAAGNDLYEARENVTIHVKVDKFKCEAGEPHFLFGSYGQHPLLPSEVLAETKIHDVEDEDDIVVEKTQRGFQYMLLIDSLEKEEPKPPLIPKQDEEVVFDDYVVNNEPVVAVKLKESNIYLLQDYGYQNLVIGSWLVEKNEEPSVLSHSEFMRSVRLPEATDDEQKQYDLLSTVVKTQFDNPKEALEYIRKGQ